MIGGGIAGLTAAKMLHPRHDVTLFEASDRVGGNAYFVTTADGVGVDIAVAVFGRAGYRNFYRLLEELGVETAMCPASYMSFHDLDTRRGLYLTSTIARLLALGIRGLNPGMLGSVARLLWGLRRAQKLRVAGELEGKTLRQLLEVVPEFTGDTRTMFLSAVALLSSMGLDDLFEAPAVFFLEKFALHSDVLSPKVLYSVRAVKNGTQAYVQALAQRLEGRIRYNAGVHTVDRNATGVVVTLASGERLAFDRVVFACPADTAYRMLAAPTDDEHRLLGAWRYKDGRVVLHRDHSAFPPRRLMQAYNFLYRRDSDGEINSLSVNGALWHEPQAPKGCDYISSQHPNFDIDPALIEIDTVLRTPIFDFDSVATTKLLPTLNGVLNSYYCGSYFGFGLHEDAVTSAMAAAKAIDEAADISFGQAA